MKFFDSVNENTSKATENAETYVKATQKYIKLKIFEQLSISIGFIAKMLVIGGLAFIGLVFLAVASALALGKLLNNHALACLLVGSILVVFSVVVYFKRALIGNKIIQILSEKFFD